jgi:hypothetical protein
MLNQRLYNFNKQLVKLYSLRPAIKVVLGFKRCLRKQVVLASVVGVILYQSRSTAPC